MSLLLDNLIVFSALFFPPLLLGLWFFGLRKYIRKHGKAPITAVSWGFSMWADWTVAWEIGQKEGKQPFSVKAFLIAHLVVIIEIGLLFFV